MLDLKTQYVGILSVIKFSRTLYNEYYFVIGLILQISMLSKLHSRLFYTLTTT